MPDTNGQSIPADWPHANCSFFIEAAGIRWHVQRAGRGPSVVLVHGTAGATHTWRDVLPLLTPHADIIAFDLPGHGFTTGATRDQLSLAGMADAVHTLLRALEVRADVGAGHSAGAAVLLQLASSHEVSPRSIIGINSALVSINALGQFLLPISRALFETVPVIGALAALLRSGVIARELLHSTGTRLDPAQEARYVSMLTDERRVGAVLQMMSRWDLRALQETFSGLRIPVTLVHSTNEPWVSFDELMDASRLLPLRTVIDVTPAGHLIPDEKPERVAAAIIAALPALDASTG